MLFPKSFKLTMISSYMTGDMLVKIHKSHRIVVAVCDKDLYGKILTEGEKSLDLTTSFFNGETINDQELKEILISYAREDATFNIIGEKSVTIAKEAKIIEEDEVSEIIGVPFAMILL